MIFDGLNYIVASAAQNQNSPEANVVGASKCDLEKTCEEPDAPASNPWLQVKCVFCSQTLVPSYEPKLLECLHAACSACINTKLQDQEQTEADIIGMSQIIKYYLKKLSFFACV